MPQIGWFELLIVVLVAILVIGPKDFPVVLKKIGSWIGSTKRYFSDIQQKFNESVDIDTSVEEKFYINTDGSHLLGRVPRVAFYSQIAAKYDGKLSAFSIPAGYAGLGRSGGWEMINTFNLNKSNLAFLIIIFLKMFLTY